MSALAPEMLRLIDALAQFEVRNYLRHEAAPANDDGPDSPNPPATTQQSEAA